jgi:16S rRNA (guanine527-N7)-methyltransferase
VARLAARLEALGLAPLAPAAAAALISLLDRIALEPQNLTAIEGLDDGIDRHLADSLAGLTLPEIAAASTLVDVGSGAGFPGLALALARPDLAVTLVESERRKADWLRRASASFPNVRVVADRSEHLAKREREGAAVVTARALGPTPVALELTAPLTAVGGAVVLWRGEPDDAESAAAARHAAAALGLAEPVSVPVAPFPGARRRLEVYRKAARTPSRYPRRAGRAARRPLGVPR